MTILKANNVRRNANTADRRLDTFIGVAENKVSDNRVIIKTVEKLFKMKKLAFLVRVTDIERQSESYFLFFVCILFLFHKKQLYQLLPYCEAN